MITGIIVALPEEIASLRAYPNGSIERGIKKGHYIYVTENLRVYCAGVGAENAKKAAEFLIDKGATQLISWGCAAALQPDLKAGDLVLADHLLDYQHNVMVVNVAWHEHIKKSVQKLLNDHAFALPFNLYSGIVLESQQLVSTAEQKATLYSTTQAIATDMESIAVAQVAQHYAVPFVVIRTIADTATMNLPDSVAKAINEKGEVEVTKVLSSLFSQPKELPELIRLGQYFGAARRTLKYLAKHLDTLVKI